MGFKFCFQCGQQCEQNADTNESDNSNDDNDTGHRNNECAVCRF